MLAKIRVGVVQQPHDELAVEDVNAHRCQEEVLLPFDAQPGVGFAVQLQRIEQSGVFRLLHETDDAPLFIDLHDAQRLGLRPGDRQGGDRQVGVGIDVLRDDATKVHPVKLVATQNHHVFEIVVEQVRQVLAHRIGRPLIPGGAGGSLFGRKNLDEAAGEMIKLVRLRDVPVKRSRVELREDVDALEIRVDAVRNRNVHQAVLARQRHGRLGPFLGQREQARPRSATHDHSKHVARVG